MSDGAPGPFTPTLRDLEGRLATPMPDRLRILRELESDLEESVARFLAMGLSPEDARSRATELLVPDDVSIAALARLHRPLYVRVTASLGEARLRVIERSALGLATAGVLTLSCAALLRADMLADPSPFLGPVLALGAALFGVVATSLFGLWVRGDHRDPGRGLGPLVGLSAAAGVTGLCGVLFDTYWLARSLEIAPGRALELVYPWLVRDSVLLAVALVVVLAGALAWFATTLWLGAVLTARDELLAVRSSTSPHRSPRR